MALMRNETAGVPTSHAWSVTAACLFVLTAIACYALWASPIHWSRSDGVGPEDLNSAPNLNVLPTLP